MGRKNADTDEESNVSVKEERKKRFAKQRSCCSPLLIIGFVFVLAAVIGFFVYFALYEPPNENDRTTSSSDENFATTPPVTPITEIPESMAEVFGDLCRNEISDTFTEEFATIWTNNETFYMVEHWTDIKSPQFYDSYLPDIEDYLVFEIQLPNDQEILISKFDSGMVFSEVFLKKSGNGLTLAERRSNNGVSLMWITSLNSEVPTDYPGLIAPASSDDPETLFFHTLKYASSTGKAKVARFDGETENLKEDNGLFAQAWLDVQGTCIGELELDQIRIESIRSIVEFGNILQDPNWPDAQSHRTEGLEDASSDSVLSTDFTLLTNLYL